ncbi:MAG: AsmA family protein [Candidatus Paracaedimonas acanthamoebae]|uniref:AsmA family protein n=1 Tax=Candidatus Paracaedimonas acanthamoebae TaxID=244581 RepID=A0A8J7PRH0_9PROT|nr:AsmA family protein [Candidatus Paracaedimonas acanthamoebae]
MKRIVLGFLAILGLLIGLALIMPLFIDVNQYKDEIKTQAKKATGRDLEIEGPIELSLFPSPALTLHQVKLANPPQAQTSHLIIFEKASVNAAFLPLLHKRIHITKVTLTGARIELEKLSNGTMNWVFSSQETSSSKEITPSPAPSQDVSSSPSFDLGIDHIRIEDTHVTYRDGPQKTTIKNLSLTASLHSLTGPYSAEGELEFDQQILKFNLKAGPLSESQPIEADLQIGELPLKINGVYTQSSQTFKGNVENHLTAKALHQLTGKTELPKFTKEGISLKALFIANPARVIVEDLTLKADKALIKGAMTVTLGDVLQVKGLLKNLPGQGTLDFTVLQKREGAQGQFKATLQRFQDFLTWLDIEAKSLPSHLLGKCSVSTHYALLKDTLQLRDLRLNLQEAELQGDIDYKLNQKTPSIQLNLKTPKVENFMPRLAPKAQQPLGSGQLRGSLQGDTQNLIFDLQTTLGTLLFSLKGQAQNLDKKPTLKIDLNGQTPNLGAFLVNLGFVSKSTYRNASLKGQITGDLENLRLTTQTTLDELSLGASGTLQNLMTLPAFNLTFNITHPNVRTFLKLPLSATPQGAISLTAHLTGNKAQFTLDAFKATIGKSFDLTGKIEVSHPNEKTKIVGSLTATSLDLDLLLARADHQQPISSESQFMLVALKAAKAPPAQHTWSKDPLSFAFLKGLEADVKVMIHQLKRKDITLTNLKITPKIQNGILDAPLTGNFSGGNLEGNFRVSADNTLALNLDLKNADLASLVPHYIGQIKLVGGKFSLNSALSTHGKSVYDFVANLTGPINLNARDGVINGFDLQAISQRLKQINNIQGLLGLLSNFMAKGQTTFQRFNSEILFKNGMGTIKTMQLIANGGNGQATGTINLPGYLVNVAAEFRLTDHAQLPPFKMYLTGPLDNPHRNLETQALQNYLIQNVFKGVVDQLSKGTGKIGDVLESILGQDQGTQQPQSDSEKASQKPEKVVKDLLKKLF